jgi:hypothetical protein
LSNIHLCAQVINTKATRYLVGGNISKMIGSPIVRKDFALEFEAQKVVNNYFNIGIETGYSHYTEPFHNVRNFTSNVFFIKPSFIFSPFKNWLSQTVNLQTYASIPLIFLKEKGAVEIPNEYYGNYIYQFERPLQFAKGIEFAQSIVFRFSSHIFISSGMRCSPWLHCRQIMDNAPFNVHYLAGSGYNQNFRSVQISKNEWQWTYSGYIKLLIGI